MRLLLPGAAYLATDESRSGISTIAAIDQEFSMDLEFHVSNQISGTDWVRTKLRNA
jgi:hypothetical protein